MGMSKKANGVASVSNRTTIFGTMGGIAPRSRIAANQSAVRNKARNQQTIPLAPGPGLSYMKGNNPMGRVMLSRNPQCSGGVGRTAGGGFAGCGATSNVSNSLLLTAPIPVITGGLETLKGGYKYHTFSTVGSGGAISIVVTGHGSKSVSYMIVGGGGGGSGQLANALGRGESGGGGGGGAQTGSDIIVEGTYNIQVGAGGVGGLGASQGSGNRAPTGVSSTFNGHASQGGQGGLMITPNGDEKGSPGGSSGTPSANASGIIENSIIGAASGGGGAGGAGGNATTNATGGTGGAEFATDSTWNPVVGSAVVPAFGYGGGGGGKSVAGATGATGGGSSGGTEAPAAAGAATTWIGGAFAGGGGGGSAVIAGGSTVNGGAGAAGIVIIRYLV